LYNINYREKQTKTERQREREREGGRDSYSASIKISADYAPNSRNDKYFLRNKSSTMAV